MIQPEIEAADQGQTLIAIAWAIDSSNQLIASCAPVFGRRSTVSPGRERVVRMRMGYGTINAAVSSGPVIR